jgi:SpoIID/LytB domain protein
MRSVVTETETIDIRRWTRSARTEPTVRIGVVLEEDQQGVIDLVLPSDAYTLKAEGAVGETLSATAIHITREGDTLSATWPGGSLGPVTQLRIEPVKPAPPTSGSGIKLKNITAGRGFHWQKKVDQTLAGALAFIAAPDGIVVVNELPLEDYLVGVITAEMSGACPVEFLKAQCVVARSWLLAMTEPKHNDQPFDRCNDDCCQRYQGTGDTSDAAIAAVTGTRGLVLIDPKGKVLDANYAKSCGGVSELAEHVWGRAKPGIDAVVDAPKGDPVHAFMPVTEANLDEFLDGEWLGKTKAFCSTHIVPVETISKYLGRVDEVDDYFRWTVNYTRAELEALLRDKLPEAAGLAKLREVRVTKRGVSGRASHLELKWLDKSGDEKTHTLDSEYRIRQVMHRGFLYSSAFAARIKRDKDGVIEMVTLRGAGWGHGAGLCQIGALGMGLTGHDVDTICRHYYPNADLETAYL